MPGVDINLFRTEKGGNPDLIKKSCERRGKDPAIVDQIIELDKVWREGIKVYIQQISKRHKSKNKSISFKRK